MATSRRILGPALLAALLILPVHDVLADIAATGTFILKKLSKAQTALLASRSTTSTKKIAKLIGKAETQVDKVGAKADAFVTRKKGPISAGCRDSIRTATGRVTQQIAANRI